MAKKSYDQSGRSAGFRGETFKKGGRKKPLKQALYEDFDIQGMKDAGTILRHNPTWFFKKKPHAPVGRKYSAIQAARMRQHAHAESFRHSAVHHTARTHR